MAKIGTKESQRRALREAQYSLRGGVESRESSGDGLAPPKRHAAQHGVDTAGVRVPKAKADVSGLRSIAGVASSPRKAIPDAARVAPRKPKPSQPPSPKASAAVLGTTTHQYRDPEKRKAYMAKYMRERRRRQAELRAKGVK